MATYFKSFLMILLVSVLSQNCFAKVDLRKTKKLVMPTDVAEPVLSAETSQKILPKNMNQAGSGQEVINQMLDNSLSLWWDSSPAKYSSVGQAAEAVEKKVKAEVNLGQSEDQKIEHKLTFKLLAMQALAKIEYTGWVKAVLNYDAKSAKTEAEVIESLSNNNDLVVSHQITALENKSQLSLRWNW